MLRACQSTGGQELKQSVSPRRQHSKYFNGTHFYAFLAFIAFIALGASAAAFFAPFFAMLNTGELKRYLGECKCHSRLASLNQTTRQVLHHTALGKRYNVKQAWTQGCKAYHRAPQSGDRSEWSKEYVNQKCGPLLCLTMFETQTDLNLVRDFETTYKICWG